MAGEYNINLSNGTVLSALYPLETNGPDNRSVARQVQDVRPQYPIALIVGAPGAGTISIVGDFTNVFRIGQIFEIADSTGGKDGTYTVANITFVGGNTQITTVENIADNVADGSLIAHVFILNGDLIYRFISTFSFDVTNSGEVDGTYTVTSLGPIINGDTTIIPVAHGSIRDNLIASIALPYGQVDYVISDTNTSLKLPGKGVMNYGEMIIEDLIRMTEHFANDSAPELNVNIGSTPAGSPLKGQLWYKTLANEEGFLHYDGTAWTNNYDVDNGSLILRDPQNTTTPNSDIYLTGDESQLPAGYTGTSESGMVIWNEADPIAQDAILRVMSVDGTENLRVEHDGYIRTANNLEVVGGGNGTVESYFHGTVGIGDNGLPTIERTLTVEGNGIAINADTGLHAGLVLDCQTLTDQSIIEFEVANVLISSIHTETDVRTVWESIAADPASSSTDIDIRTGNTTTGTESGALSLSTGSNGGNTGSIYLTTGAVGTSGLAGDIILIGGDSPQIPGDINMTAGSATTGTGANVFLTAGDSVSQNAGNVQLKGGDSTNVKGGDVVLTGGDAISNSGGGIAMNGGFSSSGNGGAIHIKGGRTAAGFAGGVFLDGGISQGNHDGGPIILTSGLASAEGFSSGDIILHTEITDYGIDTGEILIYSGTTGATTSGSALATSTGGVSIYSGDIIDNKVVGDTGNVSIYTGIVGLTVGTGTTGNIDLSTGDGSQSGDCGTISISTGDGNAASSLDGSNISIIAGSGGGAAAASGDVIISGGDAQGSSIKGIVDIQSNTSIVGNLGINVAVPTGTVDLEVVGDIKTGTVFLGGNGTITAPTYSFTNDPNSGIISAAANQLGFVTNGVNVFNIESNGTLSVNTASYETLVLADNDIPNKAYVDGAILPQYEEYVAAGGEVIVNLSIPTIVHTGGVGVPGNATLQVFLNGLFQMEGATKNYIVTGANQITFNVALVAADDVVIYSFNR